MSASMRTSVPRRSCPRRCASCVVHSRASLIAQTQYEGTPPEGEAVLGSAPFCTSVRPSRSADADRRDQQGLRSVPPGPAHGGRRRSPPARALQGRHRRQHRRQGPLHPVADVDQHRPQVVVLARHLFALGRRLERGSARLELPADLRRASPGAWSLCAPV